MSNILHFITGGGMTPEQATALGQSITNFYQGHIPNLQVLTYRYTDDVASMIQANQPNGKLILAGHSFGGAKAVQASSQMNRPVDHLILFDPVDYNGNAYSVPNTVGFKLSSNVVEAVCFFRGATEAPFSGSITSGNNYKNILFPDSGGGSASHHGDAVWDSACFNYIGLAASGHMLPVQSPPAQPVTPPPVVTPPVVAKTLISVTLNFSDGSSTTTKV
jgi:pimeloyl-ACP methyl ester carboxylesterase